MYHYSKIYSSSLLLFCSICLSLFSEGLVAGTGDTTIVQTFSYDDPSPVGWAAPYRGSYQFPDESVSYEKVLMEYSLKCDAATNHDGFDCGEWDYLTYTFVRDSSGRWDSTYREHVNYSAGGMSPYNFAYSTQPTNTIIQDWQQYIIINETLEINSAIFNSGEAESNNLLATSSASSRSQYIWQVDELTNAGLEEGELTSLALDLSAVGAVNVDNLTIRIKQTENDSFIESQFEENSFTEVYRLNTVFSESGIHNFNFLNPFNWDGASNILVEFSFNNAENGFVDALVKGEDLAWNAGAYSSGKESYLDFEGPDYVDVPVEHLSDINKEVTISFWQFGDPEVQPQSDYAFEARDANGNRVLNVHLPWDNGRVYWDAGNSGSADYDRIEKLATDAEFEGQWNHWSFVKDSEEGIMTIFLNGEEWFSGSGKPRTMEGISNFRIGSHALNTNASYDGGIDDFRIWSKALDQETIQNWMNRDLNSSHPFYSNLIAYFPFNEGAGLSTLGLSPNENVASLAGYPTWKKVQGKELFRNVELSSFRPNITFDQAVNDVSIDSLLSETIIQNSPIDLIIYGNPSNGTVINVDAPNQPDEPTNTQVVWPADIYVYTYNLQGEIIDSAYVDASNTINLDPHVWYSNVVDFEIGRFITPYGINLEMDQGFTWYYDVTDYAPLLHNKVHLTSGNNQELHDLKFIIIEGTPPREVKGIANLWSGSFSYASLLDDSQGESKTVVIPEDVSTARFKTRTTGHGFGGNSENCAEFCPKTHSLAINGVPEFSWNLWNACALNPVYPQGGTWVYDRAGWCPGDIVQTYDHEVSSFISPGESISFDYGISNTSVGAYGNYVLRGQLITYGDFNFNHDAELIEIVSPSKKDVHSRKNPICDNPVIKIRNNGQQDMTSCVITYGVKDDFGFGTFPCYYRWEGSLGFGETEEVELPLFNWTNLNPDNPSFFVLIGEPNDQVDNYEFNNYQEVDFDLPPEYESGLALYFYTNSAAYENNYTIKNDQGDIVYSGSGFSNTTIYDETFDLDPGCYVLQFNDTGEDGVAWWANSDGTGWVRLKNPNGGYYQQFEPDFGKEILHHFTIGYKLGEEYNNIQCQDITAIENIDSPELGTINMYPNPAVDILNIALELKDKQDVELQLVNTLGQIVLNKKWQEVQSEVLTIKLPKIAGLYQAELKTRKGNFSRSLIIAE